MTAKNDLPKIFQNKDRTTEIAFNYQRIFLAYVCLGQFLQPPNTNF